jgi:ubiquinone biosynthesis protein Coq4
MSRRLLTGAATLSCDVSATRQIRQLCTTAPRLVGRFVHNHEHTPLSRTHKLALTFGSALASFYNPARGDMIALLSELSGEPMLPKLRDMMALSQEGRALLLERPIINTKSVDMNYLEGLPESTFGKQYWNWLKWCNVGPDTRAKVSLSVVYSMSDVSFFTDTYSYLPS